MSFEIVSERLKALQESNVQLKDLIDRLANLKFQPGSIPLDEEEENAKAELTAEIHQIIKDQEEDLDTLQEDVIDLDFGRSDGETLQQKALLDRAVKKALEELKSLILAFRRAQIAAKRSLEEAQAQERQLLLQSYLDPTPDKPAQLIPLRRRNTPTSELSKEEKTVNASTDVTLALRRTHDMMAAELSRSQFAHDTLKESTAALAQLSETYSTLDTLLSSSRSLLGTLIRSQKSDTWYLETAFYILLTTVFWLLFRRLLYGPTWWLIWWPLKLFWKGSIGILATTGIIRGSSVSTEISSVLAHPTYSTTASASIMGSNSPSINVGDESGKAPKRPAGASSEEESVSEQVGKMIHESQNSQTGAGSKHWQQAEVEGNPKKRVWDAEKEAAEDPQRRKDEL
ncbi:hypothetical protein OIDMADRAFT_194209 [Oidiodendron maius Zn]|uniref:Sec20 C-terminal domain-containing protein n=1 Tax=Oidiodendron maius (strain Zn) TaxID=913774 RepID=A0A0C3CYE0_OIDMZ|nr:hypothetical protein OIDMADRAFT_194209 [Oidiodendron maius Zn]